MPSGHSLNLSLRLFDCEMDVIPKVSAGDQVLERPLKYFVSNRTWVSVRILINFPENPPDSFPTRSCNISTFKIRCVDLAMVYILWLLPH